MSIQYKPNQQTDQAYEVAATNYIHHIKKRSYKYANQWLPSFKNFDESMAKEGEQ
jgi:hypothetical protein